MALSKKNDLYIRCNNLYMSMYPFSGFFKTPQQGCQTTLFLACSTEVQGVTGKYFIDCVEKGLSRGATNKSKAKKLWELSEKYVNLRTTDPKI